MDIVTYISQRLNELISQQTTTEHDARQKKMLSRRALCMLQYTGYNPVDREYVNQSRPCNNSRDPDCAGHCQGRRVAREAWGLRNLTEWYSGYYKLYVGITPDNMGQARNSDTIYWRRHSILNYRYPLIKGRQLLILNGRDPHYPTLQEITVEELITLLPVVHSCVAWGRRITGNLFILRPIIPQSPPDGYISIEIKCINAESVDPELMEKSRIAAAKIQSEDPQTADDVARIAERVITHLTGLLLLSGVRSVIAGKMHIYVRIPLVCSGTAKDIVTVGIQDAAIIDAFP